MKSVLFLLTVVLWWYPSFTTLQVGWHLVVVAYNREELRGGHDLRDHQESTQQCLTGISWIAVSCPRSLSLKKNFSLVSWLLSWKHFHYSWLWFHISNLLSPKDKAPPPTQFHSICFLLCFLESFSYILHCGWSHWFSNWLPAFGLFKTSLSLIISWVPHK